MNTVHPMGTQLGPQPAEERDRPQRRMEDRLSPELRVEKYVLLSMEGKLLGPELSRIRSELALPMDADLPQDLPAGYLSRQRRSLPSIPLPARDPAELRRSSELLCAGRFPAGLSQLVTGLAGPPPPPGRPRGGRAAGGGPGTEPSGAAL